MLEKLRPSRSADLTGQLGYVRAGQTHGLVGAYLRGRAYLGLDRGAEAAAEFLTIIEHPGVAAFAPYHALAPLYFARALALADDRQRSRTAYDQFFSLWKEADADVPVLLAARAEYDRSSAR